MEQNIDIVFTYVDGTDPKWLEKKKINLNENVEINYNGKWRYENINEIYFAIKSVLCFASWINNIYIVTDDQIPPLKELYDSNKIIIIDHKEIIPSHLLPIFFSDVIESYIHNIPNLSEIFIYNNDDFFFFDKINVSDIIKNNKLKIINNFDINRVSNYTSEYSKRIINTTKKLEWDFYINNHSSKILRKSTLKYIEDEYKILLDDLRQYKFRNDITIQYLFLAINVDNKLHKNIIINNKKKFTFYDFNEDYNDTMKDKFIYKKCKFICYNGMNNTFKQIFEKLMNDVLQ